MDANKHEIQRKKGIPNIIVRYISTQLWKYQLDTAIKTLQLEYFFNITQKR